MAGKIEIVLMPGIDGTGIFFEPLLNTLSPDICATVITYPRSTILSLDGHARFVAGNFPADDTIVVAESFSGLVALMLCHIRPPQLKGVVFSATFAEPLYRTLIRTASSIPGMERLVKQLPAFAINHFLFGPFANDSLKTLLARGLPEIDPLCLKQRARLVAAGYPFPEEAFDLPCLYLQATRDLVVPQEAASWFADHFHQCEIARFDAPHCLLQTRPTECLAKIREFAERTLG